MACQACTAGERLVKSFLRWKNGVARMRRPLQPSEVWVRTVVVKFAGKTAFDLRNPVFQESDEAIDAHVHPKLDEAKRDR